MSNLNRFLQAQDKVIKQVLSELAQGEKRSHWMWFIFPQLKGLGHSFTADYYGIEGAREAREYLSHEILGKRLKLCADAVKEGGKNKTARQIFGTLDEIKFKSSLTLFNAVATQEESKWLQDALDTWFEGKPDQITLDMLANSRKEL